MSNKVASALGLVLFTIGLAQSLAAFEAKVGLTNDLGAIFQLDLGVMLACVIVQVALGEKLFVTLVALEFALVIPIEMNSSGATRGKLQVADRAGNEFVLLCHVILCPVIVHILFGGKHLLGLGAILKSTVKLVSNPVKIYFH